MSDKLYIIGNGFDLHHGIKSSYRAFGDYVRINDRRTYDFVVRYFEMDDGFWAEFEERLAYFDVDKLTDNASTFLVGYGDEEWSDSYNHDYQYEMSQAVEAVSVTLQARFQEWIRQLAIPSKSDIEAIRLPIDPSAKFLNFNYTATLQLLYGVPESRILHIHGAGTDPNAHLVLGHGWEPESDSDPYRFHADPEAADTRVVEGQRIIDGYFRDTFKPTAQIIAANDTFFTELAKTEHIYVMGHSLSNVDHPYFSEIMRHIDLDRVSWKVSYFGALETTQKHAEETGIPMHLVEFARLTEF